MKSFAWVTWKSIGILKNFTVGGNDVRSATMNSEDEVRLQYLCNYICTSLKVKPEKWLKLLMTDDYRVSNLPWPRDFLPYRPVPFKINLMELSKMADQEFRNRNRNKRFEKRFRQKKSQRNKIPLNDLRLVYIVMEWLNNSNKRILIISTQTSGFLVPSLGFPIYFKGKSCYFVKKHLIDLSTENMLTNVLCGDVSSNTIGCLSTLVDQVIYPLLNNTLNRDLWPQVIVKDIENQMQSLQNTIAEVKGRLTNKTILAVPIDIEEVLLVAENVLKGDWTINQVIKNKLEGMVIKWCHQIDDVLNNKPIDMGLFPVPSIEYNYWSLRHSNLENINSQVSAQGINTILMILKTIDSVYYTSFHAIFQRTKSSLEEARDIRVHLNALAPLTEQFETIDFNKVKPLIKPLIHCTCLTWANSIYYCTKDHWTRYFSMVCNLLIRESTKYLDSSSIFQGDIDESLSRMEDTIDILEYFNVEVLAAKSELHKFKKPGTNPIEWSFQAKVIFKRLNGFIQRLRDIRNIFQTAHEFSKLDRIEIGGVKGRNLSRRIGDASLNYQKLYSKWGFIDFDPLDSDGTIVEFEKIRSDYQENSDAIERSLAQIFIEAFNDCYTTEHCIQLIEMVGSLFDTKIIKNEIQEKYKIIGEFYHQEVIKIEEIFNKFCNDFKKNGFKAVDRGASDVTGTLKWIYKLKMRLITPIQDIQYLDYPLFRNEDGLGVMECKTQLEHRLLQFEISVFEQWKLSAAEIIPRCMAKNLIKRSTDNLLILNFENELIAALKEIKLLKSDCWNYSVPDVAAELFQLDEALWQSRTMLSRIVEWYNFLKKDTEKCEFDIIASQIVKIDADLEDAIKESNWSNYKPGYLKYIYENIQKLHKRITTVQGNVKKILRSISEWGSIPMYQRKDYNKKLFLDILQAEKQADIQNEKIKVTKELIQRGVQENFHLLFDLSRGIEKNEASHQTEKCSHNVMKRRLDLMTTIGKSAENLVNKLEAKKPIQTTQSLLNIVKGRIVCDSIQRQLFEPYERYVDQLISQTLMNSINVSICYIKSEMINDSEELSPLLGVQLELCEKYIRFLPPLKFDDNKGLLKIMENIFDNIFRIADAIPRVFQPIQPPELQITFKGDLMRNDEITEIRENLLSMVKQTIIEIEDYVHIFDEYDYIWLNDKKLHLEKLISFGGNYFDIQENDLFSDIEHRQYKEQSINLFNEEIDKWESIYSEIDGIESFQIFNRWLRLDILRFKHALLNECCKWGNEFKQHLVHFIVHNLNFLQSFIESGMETLQLNISMEHNFSLLSIMAILNDIKDRSVDYVFETLQDIINVLRNFNVDLDDSIGIQFAELPDQWYQLTKMSYLVQEKIAPIKVNQVNTISKQISVFDHKINKFRENFKQAGFFQATFDDPYELCSTMHQKMVFLEVELRKLNNSATLFKLSPPTSTKLETSRREIRLVKQIWDFVYVVESSVNDWKKTAWKRLDVEEMEQVCKKFTKDVRSLGKSVRQWQPFLHVEELLKNLLTSLRAITELQNTAIRDRHWNELMLLTGLFSKFGKEYLLNIRTNKSTTLRELLSLNLHMFEEDVKITVDKAVKEMAMEKTLNDIANVWNNMEFEYETHQRSDLQLLKVSEELIETLEENQVQVQNISTSKYIGYFEAEFIDWRMKLGNADQIVNIWSDVQRKWTYLESIFTQSEDIRKQLPDDSERFDRIDKDFRTILLDLTQSKNVMVVTNQSGLFERIEVTLSGLILCEKALNDYLETKRLAYPRFYFISSTDLLDILSHGTEPKIVGRHLTKLYDSIMKLIYRDETKAAVGMCSKENEEYVEFCAECLCTGNVEIWLNRVTDTMRATLHKLFAVAVVEYEDKTRESWIFEWPAQVSLCITQIWWSIEVNEALKKQQEGYENAMKDYQKKQISQLNALITLLLGELTPGDRQKIMTICTIDVHSRECVAKMISQRVENSSAFQWQSQLRHRWDYELNDCFANICDAQFKYDYEYLGNTPRLVITPLTDRCYVTLTQSLHLIMGGAPAGPAGTGKTETTKDLGKGLGIMVYVFNCSEQMDYRSCGNIYKGLAQTGAWGCFDEFNRISIEVLSVVAVQVKCIQDSLKTKKSKFMFMGELITLKFTVGLFITMNPGYAGRTELPENLKALFRPCAMVVPDFALICEIMLVAEGFQEARVLAKKFITLYTLCKELLSQQDHYDWGLRAIKSVLVVAGSLRRGDRQRPEDQVLMRALRDFNIPKINSDDLPIFLGLIGDLFPALDVPRRRCFEFEKLIKKSAAELRFQPEDGFLLKVVQLDEILAVRHSVFIVGNAGTGKTAIWKTLYRTYCNQKLKPHYNDLNPKGVTNDELFGIINQATREWKDGLFSVIMRDQANIPGSGPKWIVLDGDIDPMWIESLNTVMDDNKVLTLASNERIALTNEMRLLFEIADLKSATPATVSRAGILYINTDDLGWYPFVSSWIETRENIAERSTLTFLFDKYLPIVMETSKSFKRVTPTSDIAMIQMTCHLLECLLVPKSLPTDISKELYEMYFVFAIIWGFGSTLYQDQLIDWRNEFNRFWHQEFKNVRFPYDGNIFNYFIHPKTSTFRPWSDLVSEFVLDEELPLQSTLVPTPETVRLRWFLDILIDKKLPVMLIGGAGCGKSVIFGEKFSSLSENYALTNIPLNFYTSSEMLQRVGRRSFVVCATTNTSLKKILEKPLEKKAGRNYAPAGNNFMIFHVDDLNMPEVDRFGTVEAHQIIRQFMDYNHWYDRTKLTLKDIHNCQFLACMNPTAGSFTIDPRLQRHFCSFAVGNPCEDSMYTIYHTILTQHLTLEHNRFTTQHLKISSPLVTMGLALHSRISLAFLPTAVKFHYIFNLRDLANIYQGILYSNKDTCPEPEDLCRLYVHEAYRVYGDKMVCDSDSDNFRKIFRETFKKTIEEMDDHKIFKEPLIFCHFSDGLGDPKYMAVKKWSVISSVLAEAQQGYNEIVGHLNLVMFEDAIAHVCRINRILEGPRGNALLIGVGGSGKQSLARLAAYISCLNVYQIQIRRGYGIGDLRTDISTLFMKVGVKNIQSMFLITDAQVTDETFLVLINDLLASGEIPDLFADEEVDTIINAVRNEVKQSGMLDTKDNCWKHFVDKVRRMLKIVLCFSPVGEKLRKRARKFPALTNCTQIDWFHEWPKSALESVSKQFLSELDVLPSEIVESVSSFMSYVFPTVNETSQAYLSNERRFNYTTPKSFLELISLYSNLLNKKTSETYQKIERLENGLVKLAICADQVDSLKHVLAEQEIQLSAKNEAADKLIVVVSSENEIVQKEKRIAAAEEKKIRIIEEDVSIKAKLCEEDLHKAEPMLIAAQEALNTLNKNNITELKSFGTPPQAVINVCAAVLVLFSSKGKLPRDRSWKACKQMMGAVDKFLHQLIRFDKEHIPSKVISALKPYLDDREFDPQKILAKSSAASGLCAWVINIYKFYNVYLIVGPKQRALKDAQLELKAAQEKMDFFNNKILAIEEKLSSIKAEFDSAMSEKTRYQDEADKTSFTIDLAHRLVNGLGSEAIRWHQSVDRLKNQVTKLPGDVLLIACFVSYVGCFTRPYRTYLLEKLWKPTFRDLKPEIPHTEGVDPLDLICDDAQVAAWNNEGLPSDRMSTENAIILMNSVRWPLMIDPQLQGLKWIKQKFGQKLIIIQLTQKKYLDIIEKAIPAGDVVLLENIGESVDAVLDTLLSRTLIKKGKAIKIGDKEVDFSPSFKLILQTKLANPHYKPEMQAQTTLINFTVTRDGLEDQLLAEVVKAERPDLEKSKCDLTIQQNSFKISLKSLEDDLLARLSSAGENVLDDPSLVLNLEKTKKTAAEIENKVAESKITSLKLDNAREHYRAAAERSSILYFILNDLVKINKMYQFSLKAFITVFKKAIDNTPPMSNVKDRVKALVKNITHAVFMYTCRGLFERDKLVFMTQMIIQILVQKEEVSAKELDFLLRFPPHIPAVLSPFDFLSNKLWGGLKMLSMIEGYRGIDKDLEQSTKRWKAFVESETPERLKLPGEWKNRAPFQKLCIIRSLRPDRMIYAAFVCVEEIMGQQFVQSRMIQFSESFKETSSMIPVFFILSPGVDPLTDVEKLGKKLNYSSDHNNFHNVSLGQGQERVAENAINIASQQGHWVILQNIHLVAKWLPKLEKKIEQIGEDSHEDFRLFISAEPAPSDEHHIIPQGILESAIKITNEPPTGMKANLHKALDNFNQETIEMCSKEAEFKSILFALCYFHSVVAERRKFGPLGWNIIYPFNVGDLTISVYVLFNYLEGNKNVPWEDLRYLFGEIMYGGHITDDWDRRLCRTYLEEFMQPELVDGDLFFCKGFEAPPNLDYMGYHQYINNNLPSESPNLYGMHPNSEIGFLTSLSNALLNTISDLQPRAGGSKDGGMTHEDSVKQMIEEFQDKLPDEFNMNEVLARVEERTPFVVVALQECERMNLLITEIRRSLRELLLGLKGELSITADMEIMDSCLLYDKVPDNWTKLAYPSLLGLQSWMGNLILRQKELEGWILDFTLPPCVWLAGFFNPQSFLTAIMQTTARKNEWPLDKMCLSVEVTGKMIEDFINPPKEGAYIHGLYMEGARWDIGNNCIATSRLKELCPLMPVVYIKAITQDKQETKNIYECPVYRTRTRAATYIWTFNLKSREKSSKWILGGVAILLQN